VHKEECNTVVIDFWFKIASGNRIDDIKRLLKSGFKVNSKLDWENDEERRGVTALTCATEGGHVEMRSDEE